MDRVNGGLICARREQDEGSRKSACTIDATYDKGSSAAYWLSLKLKVEKAYCSLFRRKKGKERQG
jgi:hypothetical protein